MREEDKKLIIETYQNLVDDLEAGADKLKKAGNNAVAHQLEDIKEGIQENIDAMQGRIASKEYTLREYLAAAGELLIAHRQDIYHAAEILALGYILGKIL